MKAKKNKAYREGYNNPNSFNQEKLLNNNSLFAKDVIRGITDRAKDNKTNAVKFIHSQ